MTLQAYPSTENKPTPGTATKVLHVNAQVTGTVSPDSHPSYTRQRTFVNSCCHCIHNLASSCIQYINEKNKIPAYRTYSFIHLLAMEVKLCFWVQEDTRKAPRRIYGIRGRSNLKKKKTNLGKPTRTREDNIKMGLKNRVWDSGWGVGLLSTMRTSTERNLTK
jgi:hypothetical protein